MNRKLRILLLSLLPILIFSAVYLAPAVYYMGGFSFNTWVNGVYCTGKSVEEVNKELLEEIRAPVIKITDREESVYEISLESAGYTGDYREPLTELAKKQKPFLWIGNLLSGHSRTLQPQVSFDTAKLKDLWEKLPFVQEELKRESKLEIILTEDGYQLYDGLRGRLDLEKGFLLLKEAAEQGKTSIDLVEAGAYIDLEPDQEQKKLLALWEKVREFQERNIVYDMGDTMMKLKPSVMSRFLLTDGEGGFAAGKDGRLLPDREGVEAFIKELALEYNTYGLERQFVSTRGDIVTVKGGTYGTQLDTDAEIRYLMQALSEGWEETHTPAYRREAFCRGKDDIGGTYVEVDMTQQKMYYYQNGERLLETDIVTGNTSRHMGTPQGVNFVYAKQKDRILRGPGYASPVKFWMPVNGNIGIHDAGWRSSFGGDIYQKSGSHGCINTPRKKMEELYDMVEIGTPVVMFY